MSVNKFAPHVLVLPEDDATRQMATGFQLHGAVSPRAIQILPPSGGWRDVRSEFATTHAAEMRRYVHRHMVLLVDFDQAADRLTEVQQAVPEDIAERVFVVGVLSEPEDLRRDTAMPLEEVGRRLATECSDGTRSLWNHALLQHNAAEVERMTRLIRPFLFRS